MGEDKSMNNAAPVLNITFKFNRVDLKMMIDAMNVSGMRNYYILMKKLDMIISSISDDSEHDIILNDKEINLIFSSLNASGLPNLYNLMKKIDYTTAMFIRDYNDKKQSDVSIDNSKIENEVKEEEVK